MAKFIEFLKRKPFFTALLAIVVAMISLKTIPSETFLENGVERMLLCGTMLFFLYQISGERTTSQCGNSTWYVIKVCIGFWIFAALLGLPGTLIGAGGSFQQGWPIQMAALAYMMLFVGLFEELTFRAILNDAIISHFRNSKHAFLISAIVCSLVFGAMHVVGAPLTTPLEWAQAVLKTLSTGIFGLGLLFIYWKTRNVWACGIVHGGYDFLLSIGQGLYGQMEHAGYVISGEAGLYVCIIYIITGLIEAFIVWRIWRAVKRDLDFEQLRLHW